mgnify:CR=1 FL=1
MKNDLRINLLTGLEVKNHAEAEGQKCTHIVTVKDKINNEWAKVYGNYKKCKVYFEQLKSEPNNYWAQMTTIKKDYQLQYS